MKKVSKQSSKVKQSFTIVDNGQQSFAVKATKPAAARSFILDKAAAQKMQALNWNEDECSLVRDDKGQMFTRIYRPEIKKGGKWRPLPESTWLVEAKMEKIGWYNMTPRQKRKMYTMTPVTQVQALKWLINDNVQHEFKAEFAKMFKAVCYQPDKQLAGERLFTIKSMVHGVSTDKETKGAAMVKLEMVIYAPEDTGHKKPLGICHDNLVRWSRTEWKVAEFFTAIGIREHAPQWDMVPGATGRAVFCPETIKGKTIMKVKRYMDPEEVLMRLSA